MRHRRRPPHHRKSSELWAMIYIDLMTQIMAFFVIVWAVDLNDKDTATQPLATGMGMGVGDQSVRMVDLPGDVLFASGKVDLGAQGRDVIAKLFGDPDSGVLSFDQGGLAMRKLVIHGHTDDLGKRTRIWSWDISAPGRCIKRFANTAASCRNTWSCVPTRTILRRALYLRRPWTE
jgi:flagellar motor protein MotB